MASKSPLLQLPAELRNQIYRVVAIEDIKICLVTASRIAISHPLAQACKQVQSEFVPILREVHPGGVVPKTVKRFLLDMNSIPYGKLSAKMIMVSAHAAEHGIKDLSVKYIALNKA